MTCPLFPTQPNRCDIVLALKRTSASLSVLGCLFLIFLIWLFQKYKFFGQRMVLSLGIAALLDSVSYIMGDIYPEGQLCDAQAFLMSYFDWSVLCWVCCITFNLWLLAIKRVYKKQYEKWYHAVCWGLPLIWAAVPLIGGHYGPAGVWCWIDNSSFPWRFGVWYVPLFILIIVMVITNSYIVWKVYRQASEFEGTFNQERETDMKLLKEEVKRMLAYPLIYLILSICPLIFRIHDASHKNGPTSYPLLVLTVIFGPLQGACNAIAFAMDNETWKRLTWTEIKLALRSRSLSGSSQVIHNYQVDDAAPDTPGHSPNSSPSSDPGSVTPLA